VGDDRSGIYFALEDARDAAKDSTGLRSVREEHVAMLESEASKAKSAEQRAVYDSHRVSLYIALGRPENAIPMLEQSRSDFPDDYNPRQRLATVYKEMKQWREALAASDEALARAYGPRQFLVLNTRADIQLGMGDKSAAEKTLTDALAKAEAMPDGQKSEGTINNLKRRIAKLNAGTN
jgi:tetratricopeptide (TPR) repeat protein